MTDGKHFNCTGKKDLKVCSYGIFINLMAQMENAAIFWANDIKEAESKYKDKDFKKNHTVWNWNPDGYSAYPESGSWSKSGVKVKDLDKIATYGYTWKGDYPSKDSTMNSLESLVSIGSYLLEKMSRIKVILVSNVLEFLSNFAIIFSESDSYQYYIVS